MMDRRRALKIFGMTATGLVAVAFGAKRYWDDFQAKRRTNLLIAGSAPMISYIQRVAASFIQSHKNIDIVTERGTLQGHSSRSTVEE